jgi:hypothetical protein
VAGAKIISEEIFAENGFIYKTDRVNQQLKKLKSGSTKRIKAEHQIRIMANAKDYEIFKEIWDEKKDKDGNRHSEVSNIPLHYFFGPRMFFVFSHILAKGPYPGFRHYKKNIVLMTWNEHQLWEFHTHKIKDDPKWKWVFDLKDELKQEYYQGKK